MVKKFEPVIECMKAVLPSRMKGKTIMWWMSFNAVGLWWYSALAGKTLDGSIATMYGAALLAFAGSKGFEYYQQNAPGKQTTKQPALPAIGKEDPPGGYQ